MTTTTSIGSLQQTISRATEAIHEEATAFANEQVIDLTPKTLARLELNLTLTKGVIDLFYQGKKFYPGRITSFFFELSAAEKTELSELLVNAKARVTELASKQLDFPPYSRMLTEARESLKNHLTALPLTTKPPVAVFTSRPAKHSNYKQPQKKVTTAVPVSSVSTIHTSSTVTSSDYTNQDSTNIVNLMLLNSMIANHSHTTIDTNCDAQSMYENPSPTSCTIDDLGASNFS